MKRARATLLRGERQIPLTVVLAVRWWQRLRGLLGRPAPAPGEALWLAPCNSIHTWGMGYAIDVVFVDRQQQIVKVLPALAPWRLAGARRAHGVLELAAGQVAQWGLQPGDRLQWSA